MQTTLAQCRTTEIAKLAAHLERSQHKLFAPSLDTLVVAAVPDSFEKRASLLHCLLQLELLWVLNWSLHLTGVLR